MISSPVKRTGTEEPDELKMGNKKNILLPISRCSYLILIYFMAWQCVLPGKYI